MDKDIVYINTILNKNNQGVTTAEISKKIFEEFDIKISRTIVKNYLWSYFRSIIEYNSSTYSYKLKSDPFLINDINVVQLENVARPISSKIEGSSIIISVDKNIPFESYIKAIGVINFKIDKNKKSVDLIKLINRTIEQLSE
jgi:hypothetical protein